MQLSIQDDLEYSTKSSKIPATVLVLVLVQIKLFWRLPPGSRPAMVNVDILVRGIAALRSFPS
jgi:hypothetical protein